MKLLKKIASVFISITFPFVLIMFSIRILFTPLFLQVEYNRPGFPSDSFGFSIEERTHWGTQSILYMFNDEGSSFMENLRLNDGSRLYNDREVSHMLDVKILLQKTLRLFYVFLIVYLLIFLFFLRDKNLSAFWRATSYGGKFTLGLIGLILVAVLVSFDVLFTYFHKLFFTGDTWLFNYSDSLIRLFPMQLWQDAFLLMGIITLGLALFFSFYKGNAGRNKIISS